MPELISQQTSAFRTRQDSQEPLGMVLNSKVPRMSARKPPWQDWLSGRLGENLQCPHCWDSQRLSLSFFCCSSAELENPFRLGWEAEDQGLPFIWIVSWRKQVQRASRGRQCF